MAFRPLANENAAYRELYLSIAERVAAWDLDRFNLEDLFSDHDWQRIGNGSDQQHFGKRFANAVRAGQFPDILRNGENPGGNEARYIKQLPME